MKAKLLNLLQDKNKINLSNAGVAALPTLLLIGGIITIISISLTTSVYLYINSAQGSNLSLRALSTAKSGAYDGIMKVTRDKNFNDSYVLSVGIYSATVDVFKDDPVAGKSRIDSVGGALTRRKKMQAIVTVDPITGLVKLESMLETAL
jgi:hypothetical protein